MGPDGSVVSPITPAGASAKLMADEQRLREEYFAVAGAAAGWVEGGSAGGNTGRKVGGVGGGGGGGGGGGSGYPLLPPPLALPFPPSAVSPLMAHTLSRLALLPDQHIDGVNRVLSKFEEVSSSVAYNTLYLYPGTKLSLVVQTPANCRHLRRSRHPYPTPSSPPSCITLIALAGRASR